jgi:ATP-dependent DNA helicase RecG
MTRLDKGENLHTEFKEWPINSDNLASPIVAFANTDGGQILLGVDDNGHIVGIEKSELDRVTQFVDNVAFNNCEPPVTVIQETIVDEQERIVLVVHVPKGDQRPYRTNRGVYYVRTTSGRRQASRAELLRLFQATESLYYDETPILRSSMIYLDNQAIERLLKDVQEQGVDVAGISRNRLLLNWNLIQEINEKVHPTVAGILFLAQHPQRFLPNAYISALRIPGTDISVEPQDQKRIEGRLVEMLQDTMRFLNIHLRRPHQIQGLEPEVKPEIPAEVLREALVNSLAHRDYTISAPVRVIIYDDRVDVRTPGQLPNTVTVDALRVGVHVLRNPTIYNIFLKVGLVTDAGSGIPRMIRILREAKGYEPDFRVEANEFVVSIPRPS